MGNTLKALSKIGIMSEGIIEILRDTERLILLKGKKARELLVAGRRLFSKSKPKGQVLCWN